MFKLTAIALTITASSATAVIPADTPTPDSHTVQQVYYESAQCRTAQRQIAIYSRALSRLDMAAAQHRRKAAIYRHARETERDWQEQNCRPVTQTAASLAASAFTRALPTKLAPP